MKMRSPWTTGVEFPRSGRAVFHFTLVVAFQVRGRSVSLEMPEPSAPRQPGHGALRPEAVRRKSRPEEQRRERRAGDMGRVRVRGGSW
jgi:hypothetical protein